MNKRLPYNMFKIKLIKATKMDNVKLAIYGPILYNAENKYFDACMNFIDTGVENEVVFSSYSADLIKRRMVCSYIEALVILMNIEENPLLVDFIYRPMITE